MSDKYAVNTKVEWEWGSGTGQGKIREVFTERVSRTIKGNEVTRNATEDDPACLIEQDDGDRVLKSHSELRKAGGPQPHRSVSGRFDPAARLPEIRREEKW
jgi:Hypervirulence associated proteins TUDOR domain